MQTRTDSALAREHAVACARRIFYRPQTIVDTLLESLVELPGDAYPGSAGVARMCFQQPIGMGSTLAVFGLRALHWPMLNLLDAAERQRRAFADAMAHAVEAARGDA